MMASNERFCIVILIKFSYDDSVYRHSHSLTLVSLVSSKSTVHIFMVESNASGEGTGSSLYYGLHESAQWEDSSHSATPPAILFSYFP